MTANPCPWPLRNTFSALACRADRGSTTAHDPRRQSGLSHLGARDSSLTATLRLYT